MYTATKLLIIKLIKIKQIENQACSLKCPVYNKNRQVRIIRIQ